MTRTIAGFTIVAAYVLAFMHIATAPADSAMCTTDIECYEMFGEDD